ncbi:MAG TPA: DUF6765 family protein [Magnetospirillaceae bacterium]|jgi:hypothetical protein
MDIEFHYYMTYLIAARAGFTPAQATIIGTAAQGVDDNHIIYTIAGDGDPYQNYISQTMDILKPAKRLNRIYPIYHFIPGVKGAESARRKDKAEDDWITTPDSPLARKMIDAALASGDLHRIGVSAHGYVDTWAHQNFVGHRSDLNYMVSSGVAGRLLCIGHGDAGHHPDKPALIWTDARLAADTVDNRHRFLDAAEALYRRFAGYVRPTAPSAQLDAEVASLRTDLDADIGPTDPGSVDAFQLDRIVRYRARATTAPYGGVPMPDYDAFGWFNVAVKEDGSELKHIYNRLLDFAANYVDQPAPIACHWDDQVNYRTTDWYLFSEAIKEHQNECWSFLEDAKISGLDAPEM